MGIPKCFASEIGLQSFRIPQEIGLRKTFAPILYQYQAMNDGFKTSKQKT